MAFIDLVTDEAAEGDAAELLAALRATGDVPNHARLLANRPRVLRAWRELLGTITEHMDPRRYELATLGVARALGSSYCMLAHGKVILDRGFSDAAAARCFFSSILDALGVQADASHAALGPGLRDALTIGRPIAGS